MINKMLNTLVDWMLCRIYHTHRIPFYMGIPGSVVRCERCRRPVRVNPDYTLTEIRK